MAGLTTKCSSLRFIFIDEIEASGAELLSELEENLRRNAPKRYRLAANRFTPRAWGGINVVMGGDWWQLPAVGQTPLMSNPYHHKVLESAKTSYIMNMFWVSSSADSVKSWSEQHGRVLELTVNKRSGADVWFSEILTASRLGTLSDTQYCFLHGFPTKVCGSWSETSSAPLCGNAQCAQFSDSTRLGTQSLTEPYLQRWRAMQENECSKCSYMRVLETFLISIVSRPHQKIGCL